ncbi:MAG: DUF2339 domain-containing protein [Oscillospiraceae bacterium]|nr:DUF2339 domain-containing protein [Oscillospiraceae bacterium]
MSTADNLKSIISRQKEILAELETECQSLEESDLVVENSTLVKEIEKIRKEIESINARAAEVTQENVRLKNALHEQMFNEKAEIIGARKAKLDVYYQSSVDKEMNRLSAIEKQAKDRIDGLKERLSKNNIAADGRISSILIELTSLIDSRITEAQRETASVPAAFSQDELNELDALKNEQLSDDQVNEASKKNNIERFVGLNILNAVGVLLLIVGAITLARFTYFRLTDELKGIMLFSLGGIMLALGELLNKKSPNVFSLGISAGGIAILYAALVMSYFGLDILSKYPALLVCVLITSGAFIFSNRYNAQIIAIFALFGGYMPLIVIGSDPSLRYGAMGYFILLNFLALLISTVKKWRISSFVGLFLNLVSTLVVYSLFYSRTRSTQDTILVILYVMFAFIIYTAIPIISTFRTGSRFRASDVVLLAINTVFSSLILYFVFWGFKLTDFNGLLAISFAAIYLLIGRFIESKFNTDERNAKALFYITGLAFVIMVIPLQFDYSWLSLGWLAEGVLLLIFGILSNEKGIKIAGAVVYALCFLAFALYDCMRYLDFLFVYKYTAITLGSLGVLAAFIYKKTMSGMGVKAYKYFTLANFWLFGIYLILIKLRSFIAFPVTAAGYQIEYLLYAASIVCTIILAYGYSRTKLLSDMGTKIMTMALYFIAILSLIILNSKSSPVYGIVYFSKGTPMLSTTIIGSIILLLLSGLTVFALRDLMLMIVSERKLGIEWYPFILSAYFVTILTHNLISQYNLSFSNAIISVIYVLTALGWILYGFSQRYSFVRLFGLGLSILAVIKLFLLDLYSLTQGYRIISYFALGITLIVISFVYQYFNKRLENTSSSQKEGVSNDA